MAKDKFQSNTEITVKQTGGAVAEFVEGYDFGGENQFNFRDLIIPKLFLMQGLSDLVAEGVAKMGDIVDTAANEIIGSVREKDRKPVRFYPLQMYRYWVHRKMVDNELKFENATPWTPENADMKWEVLDSSGKVIGKNEETVVFAVVREDQIDNLEEPPRLLSFRSTSLKQTKQLKHHFLMCLSTRKEVPFQTVFELSGRLEKNEKGSWFVPECLPRGKATADQALKLMEFYKRYGKMIKEKIAGLLDEDEIPTASQGAEATARDVGGSVSVEAEGGRAKF